VKQNPRLAENVMKLRARTKICPTGLMHFIHNVLIVIRKAELVLKNAHHAM